MAILASQACSEAYEGGRFWGRGVWGEKATMGGLNPRQSERVDEVL